MIGATIAKLEFPKLDGVLVIHRQVDVREYLTDVLVAGGYRCRVAYDLQSALREIVRSRPALVLIADRLNDGPDDMLAIVDRLAGEPSRLRLVVLCDPWNGDIANRAIARGAHDAIQQPWDPIAILRASKRAIEGERCWIDPVTNFANAHCDGELVGTSKATVRLREAIDRVAQLDQPVLISGPSGSGREFVARQIHRKSCRSTKPFVVANCTSIDPTLVERTLFGSGSAGGMAIQHLETGLCAIERAHGGTVLIGGIEAMPASCQRKLSRFLLDGALERASVHINVDVRVIAMTTCDLAAEVKAGNFLEDLYHRLRPLTVSVPTLADRRDDIPILTRYFVQKLAARTGLPFRNIDPSTLASLQAAEWPGHARELYNIVERLLIVSDSRNQLVNMDALPLEIPAAAPGESGFGPVAKTMGFTFKQARAYFERWFLAAQLARFSGNISRTAECLGMGRSTLHRKIRGISGPGE